MKTFIENLLGVRIYRNRLPKGTNLIWDLKNDFAFPKNATVIDVGANEGQNIGSYLTELRASRVIAVEPQPHLAAKIRALGNSRVHVECCALSDVATAEAEFSVPADRNFLGSLGTPTLEHQSGTTMKVPVRTLDELIESQRIDRVDFLKIDTEGHDLAVLRGATETIRQNRISLVLVEATVRPGNEYHLALSDLITFFYAHEFQLYGFYDQIDGYVDRELLYFNALFFHNQFRERLQKTAK